MTADIRLYTDGGVILKNPSPIGGTWAYVAVDQFDRELWRRSGVITPKEMTTDVVSNNQTELLAVIYGLQRLPHYSSFVQVCSDSQVTLGRVFGKSPFNNIPEWMCTLLEREKHRLINFSRFTPQQLGGHPTRQSLIKGTNKKRQPVSKWNVLCDVMCHEAGDAHLVYIKSFEKGKIKKFHI